MKERAGILLLIIIIFAATYMFFSAREGQLLKEKDTLQKQYQKIYSMAEEYKVLSSRNKGAGRLQEGLLSFVQSSGSMLNLSDRIATVKPIPGSVEGVSVLYQGLNFTEIVEVLKVASQFSNIQVRAFSISKRFDDPGYADLNMQIEKIK
ncbi:hypothetical protein MNBD_NITROSPIRAE02-349 [hydrothermal vent metagenome]|uniref:General secretion pathway protein M n=1 Tax=hydrothermal vent metagenome TaxID=652676 RepID=A0A3B1CYR1_9ZZZZ